MGLITIFVCAVVFVCTVIVGLRILQRKAVSKSSTLPMGTIRTFRYRVQYKALLEKFSKMRMERHINFMVASGWEIVKQTGLPGQIDLEQLRGACTASRPSILRLAGQPITAQVRITFRRERVPG